MKTNKIKIKEMILNNETILKDNEKLNNIFEELFKLEQEELNNIAILKFNLKQNQYNKNRDAIKIKLSNGVRIRIFKSRIIEDTINNCFYYIVFGCASDFKIILGEINYKVNQECFNYLLDTNKKIMKLLNQREKEEFITFIQNNKEKVFREHPKIKEAMQKLKEQEETKKRDLIKYKIETKNTFEYTLKEDAITQVFKNTTFESIEEYKRLRECFNDYKSNPFNYNEEETKKIIEAQLYIYNIITKEELIKWEQINKLKNIIGSYKKQYKNNKRDFIFKNMCISQFTFIQTREQIITFLNSKNFIVDGTSDNKELMSIVLFDLSINEASKFIIMKQEN